jgi:hypothetical protein
MVKNKVILHHVNSLTYYYNDTKNEALNGSETTDYLLKSSVIRTAIRKTSPSTSLWEKARVK